MEYSPEFEKLEYIEWFEDWRENQGTKTTHKTKQNNEEYKNLYISPGEDMEKTTEQNRTTQENKIFKILQFRILGYGDMEISKIEIWRYGDMEIWRFPKWRFLKWRFRRF